MEQWQSPYSDAAGASRRYNSSASNSNSNSNSVGQGHNHLSRDFNGQQQQHLNQQQNQHHQHHHQQQQQQHHTPQPPIAFKYDQYPSSQQSQIYHQQQQQHHHNQQQQQQQPHQQQHHHHIPSLNTATSPIATPQIRDGNGDVAMSDAHDQYSGMKYPMRPHHQAHLSAGARPSNLHSPQESSAAAQRYSPMEVMSPTSPYSPYTPKSSSAGGGSHFSSLPPQQRQSPTRGASDYGNSLHSPYPPQSPYYPSRQSSQSQGHSQSGSQQLPPISSHTGAYDGFSLSATTPTTEALYPPDPKSPRRVMPPPTYSAPQPVPELKKLRALSDLRPKVSAQPPFRRANPEGGFISPLQALTVHLPATYRICNPSFKYESSRNPRRVLTKPSKGTKNDGYDNEDSDYILYVNDILGSEEAGHKNRYLILDVLGQGTFGQVVKCQNLKTQEVVAVKVIKNRTAYFNQSMMEVSVLDLQNQFRGLSTTLVRVFAQQLLNGLALLNKARLIHCDLKPENILLKNLESPIIKIIDFGSACDERQTVYTYIQSRFYRSPEVLLGLPYSSAIDMWSLGCIVVELFLGLPLFPGSSEYNQVSRIVEMLGNPPNWMLEMGKQSGEFFEKRQDEFGRRTYQLKSMEQIAFIDFVRGLLTINPLERWSPQQAKLHPFITQQKYTGPFVPPMNLKSSSLNRSPAPGTQQQQQAEALSKQRAQAAQAQANSAVQGAYASMASPAQYQHQPGHPPSAPPVYANNSVYAAGGSHAPPAPPPYATSQGAYGQMSQSQPPAQMPPANYAGVPPQQGQQQQQHQSQNNMYAQQRSRPRASTMEQHHQSGIPAAIQRVASHLDPSQPIRLQPSPAYYPPPSDSGALMDNTPGRMGPNRRGSRAQPGGRGNNKDFIRNLEERTLEEGFMSSSQQGSWN
uniref:Serine/threonine-protein kinase ppk15 n=1 Tax=Pyricularia oryzae (strain P131) TaxID=1143193 RepID=L7JDJ3_PYRO1